MSVTLIRPNGEELQLTSPTRSFESHVTVTDHPLEDGTTISDHIEVMPDRITIEGVVSETTIGGDGTDSVRWALDFLNEAGRGAELLELETRYGVFEPLVLLEWPYDETQLRGLTFQLVLREVQIANVETVRLPREIEEETDDDEPAEAGEEEIECGPQPLAGVFGMEEGFIEAELEAQMTTGPDS